MQNRNSTMGVTSCFIHQESLISLGHSTQDNALVPYIISWGRM